MNVLKKIVLPRTNVTIGYILTELEEMAREEFHRLKKVKEKRRKEAKKYDKHDHQQGHFCPICDKRMESKPKVVLEEDNPVVVLEAKEISIQEKPTPKVPEIVVLKDHMELPSTAVSVRSAVAESDINTKLNYIKIRLTDIIVISRDFIDMGLDTFDVNEFLKICETAKLKLEQYFGAEQSSDQMEDRVKHQLQNLNTHLREIVETTKDIKNEGLVTSSIDKFIEACEAVDNRLKEVPPKPGVGPKNQLEEMIEHIDDVIKMTQDYKSEGLLEPGVEEFLKSCNAIKFRLEGKTEPKDINEDKLDHLKDHVSELEDLTIGLENKQITSASVEKFVSACKDFKMKIKEGREMLLAKKSIKELTGHIDETVEIGKEADKEGLLSESVEDFIKKIGDMKTLINQDDKRTSPDDEREPTVLDALKLHIDNIIKSISKLKSGNLITASVDDFLKSCETAKAKIDIYQKYFPIELEEKMLYPTCGERCVCDQDDASDEEVCERCKEMGNEVPYAGNFSPPCGACQGEVKEKESQPMLCATCSRPLDEELLLPEPSPIVSPEESDVCEVCESYMNEAGNSQQIKIITPELAPVDSSLGYFEKKVRKITKVTRTQNPDGTIREEKETITVKKEKHDPTETSLLDDDENEEYDVSYESLLDEEDEKQIAMCSMPNQNQLGFLQFNRKAKSETVFRVSPMTIPRLKNYISVDAFELKDSVSPARDTSSVELDVYLF